MNWLDFTLGFWHTFGAHAGEGRDAIIVRKQREIARNQWTLWSFQHRRSLDVWRAQVSDSRPIYVLCSDSPCAIDPSSSPTKARFYRTALHSHWGRIPKASQYLTRREARDVAARSLLNEFLLARRFMEFLLFGFDGFALLTSRGAMILFRRAAST